MDTSAVTDIKSHTYFQYQTEGYQDATLNKFGEFAEKDHPDKPNVGPD